MSILSKLFRKSENQKIIDQLIEESRRKTARQLKPLEALGNTIIQTSEKCRDGIRVQIQASDEKDRQRMQILSFYEFVYFFMHLMMRHAFVVMTETEKQHLGRQVHNMIVSVCVDAYFQHWPDELKKGMATDFSANLQKAEMEYAACAPGNIFSGPKEAETRRLDALFSTLAENVALSIGREDDTSLKCEIAALAAEQFVGLNFMNLVLDFKRDSMELPDRPI